MTTSQDAATRLQRARSGVGVGGSGRPGRSRNAIAAQTRRTYSTLIIPSVVLLLLINAYPFVVAAYQSVHDGSLISGGTYVGLDNYVAVLTSESFWKATRFTLIFTIVGVFGSWALGLAFALLLRTRIPGNGLFKVLAVAPLGGTRRGVSDGLELAGRHPAKSGPASARTVRHRERAVPRQPDPRLPSRCASSRCGSASPS